MMITLTHLVEVVTDGFEHRPLCSCGWCGDWTDAEAAVLAGVEHRDGEAGPLDEVDRCISGLLDVQDDIARAVIWLAQNWSAGLPVPGWYASGGDDSERPVVTVFAPCLNDDELTRVAAALDVAPVDDEQPNTRGVRYRRAERRFGRVLITASLLLGRGDR